jgi:hypothetical protein
MQGIDGIETKLKAASGFVCRVCCLQQKRMRRQGFRVVMRLCADTACRNAK